MYPLIFYPLVQSYASCAHLDPSKLNTVNLSKRCVQLGANRLHLKMDAMVARKLQGNCVVRRRPNTHQLTGALLLVLKNIHFTHHLLIVRSYRASIQTQNTRKSSGFSSSHCKFSGKEKLGNREDTHENDFRLPRVTYERLAFAVFPNSRNWAGQEFLELEAS